MKKALVYVNEIDGRSVGSVSMVMEASDLDAWTHYHTSDGFALKVEVPQAHENIPENYLEGVLVPAEGEVPEHWEIQPKASYADVVKANTVTGLYQTMVSDVYAQMAVVFGTSDANSASAYERTWDLMAQTPSDWSAAGLKAAFAVGGLAIGDVLDTDQKVLDYANAKLAEIKAYGIWRMQRIDTFKADKDAVLAS